MLIGRKLRALRVDEGPQRHAQAAMHGTITAWRRSEAVRAVDAALEALDAGTAFADLPVLAQLTSAAGARAFAAALLDPLGDTLDAQPLAHVAMRHTNETWQSSLLISKRGRVTLSLHTRMARPGGEPFADSCVLTDIDTWDAVLAGAAEGRRIVASDESGARDFSVAPIRLERGDRMFRQGRCEALAIDRIERTFTVLRLQRRARAARPAQAYDLAGGSLLRQVAGEVQDSRKELAMALLGRMGRVEDAPLIADLARGSDNPAVRWEAVRECLALDTATGFRVLAELARRVGDPLQPDAATLHAHLLAAHPQLATLEEESLCPA